MTTTTAKYRYPSKDDTRPGTFYVGTADLQATVKPMVKSMTLNEGSPGHHLQYSYAMDAPYISDFRLYKCTKTYNFMPSV